MFSSRLPHNRMWPLVIASAAPTIAALAAWRRPRGVAALERLEAKVDDMLDWQVQHERDHIRLADRRRERGGQQ